MDAAVHEDVVDAAAPLRPEDLHDVRPALGDEESAGLEHEAGRVEAARSRAPPSRPASSPFLRISEIQRPFAVGVGHAEAAAEIHGAQGNVVFLRK